MFIVITSGGVSDSCWSWTCYSKRLCFFGLISYSYTSPFLIFESHFSLILPLIFSSFIFDSPLKLLLLHLSSFFGFVTLSILLLISLTLSPLVSLSTSVTLSISFDQNWSIELVNGQFIQVLKNYWYPTNQNWTIVSFNVGLCQKPQQPVMCTLKEKWKKVAPNSVWHGTKHWS